MYSTFNFRSTTYINNVQVEYPSILLVKESIDTENPSKLFNVLNPLLLQDIKYLIKLAKYAACHGKLKFLTYLFENNIINDETCVNPDIIAAAAYGNKLNCLKYLIRRDMTSIVDMSSESRIIIMNMAFRNDDSCCNLGCIKFLIQQGFLLEPNNIFAKDAVLKAASDCNYLLLQYFYQNGFQFTEEHLNAVASSRGVSSIKRFNCFMYIHKKIGVSIPSDCIEMSLIPNDDDFKIHN